MKYEIKFLREEIINLYETELQDEKYVNYDFYVYRAFFNAKKKGWNNFHKIVGIIRVKNDVVDSVITLYNGKIISIESARKMVLGFVRKTLRNQIEEPK